MNLLDGRPEVRAHETRNCDRFGSVIKNIYYDDCIPAVRKV